MPAVGRHEQGVHSTKTKRKLFGWRIERLEGEETHKVFQKENINLTEQFEAVLTSTEDDEGNRHVAGQRVIGAWENRSKCSG